MISSTGLKQVYSERKEIVQSIEMHYLTDKIMSSSTMYGQNFLAPVIIVLLWRTASSLPAGSQFDYNQPIRKFLAEEPSSTPQGIISFMDQFPMKSFDLFMTIHRILKRKCFTIGQQHEVSMTEAVAHTLRTVPGLTNLTLMKYKHTPIKIFESIWRRELVRPCRKVNHIFDAHLESLPQVYTEDDFQPTRVGTLLLFEDICRRLKSETSPLDVRAKLIEKKGSPASSSTS